MNSGIRSKNNLTKCLVQQMNKSGVSKFYIYLIELCGNDAGIKKPLVITKQHRLHQFRDNILNLVYVKMNEMQSLSLREKALFKARLNNPRTYVIYDISNCQSNGEIQKQFRQNELLLGESAKPRVTEEFFIDNIYFIISRRSNQSIQSSYIGALPNCIYEFSTKTRYYTLWGYIADIIQTHHPLDFPDKAMLKSRYTKDVYIKALCGDGKAQFKYAKTFKFNHYISYLLWAERALENGSRAALNTNYSVLAGMDFDKKTVERHYLQMLENGLTSVAGMLYDMEKKKNTPKKSKMEFYLDKGIENVTLTDYYNYAIHYCFALNGSDYHNHENALIGFERFVQTLERLPPDNEEKYEMKSLLHYVYYAYAIELGIMDEKSPDLENAFKYYKKSLNEDMYFADKILSIGKEFCFGDSVEINLKHGTDILCWLAKIGYEEARKFLPEAADRLMCQKHFAAAQKCYEQCLEFNTDYSKKYILSVMCRKIYEQEK